MISALLDEIRDFCFFMLHQPKRWWCLNVAGHAWGESAPAPHRLIACRRCHQGKGW